jgi:tripartite-type tricarboxylate transporter receptor subunit TctC
MKIPRRRFLRLVAGAAALPALSRIASAQSYPTRPVHIIVGFSAGGATDVYARLIGQWLSHRLGQQFIVENRAGAGGNLATEAVIKAVPDGYTLLMCAANDAVNPAFYSNLNFNFIRDIAPVARITRGMGVLVVHPSFTAKTVPEFIGLAKANPGRIVVASSGIGSAQHLYLELFKVTAGVDMLHVPYRGGGPALVDLLGGQVPVMFDTLATSVEHIKSGRLRALAVTDVKRSEVLPEVPTVGEFLPGYEATAWSGVCAPRNTPAGVIDRLNREINAGLYDPNIRGRLTDLGVVPMPMTAMDFGKFIAEYADKWGQVIRAAHIKVE